MAQEFASDNSKNGLFDRLKLSNHRGFFSFIFVSLSLILLLVTFAAVQQQQTTQSKAAVDLCTKVICSNISPSTNPGDWALLCERNTCCNVSVSLPLTCINDTSKHLYCSGLSQSLCSAYSTSCDWDSYDKKCVDEGTATSLTGDKQNLGEACRVASSNCYGVLICVPNRTGSLDGKCDYPTVGVGDRCKSDGTDGYSRGDTIAKCQEGLTCSNIDAGTCVRSTTGTIPTPTPPGGGTGGGADSACTSIGGRCLTGQTGRDGKDCKNQPGVAKSGKIQSGLCSGGEDRKCCVPNSITDGGGADSACTTLSGRCLTGQTGREGKDCKAIAGQAKTGKIQGGDLCTGAPDRMCCVPNSATDGGTGPKVTCTDPALQTQAACLPADQCTWLADKNKCQRVCERILEKDKNKCVNRADCEWKDNACVTKADGGGDEASGSADLNLKLAFQGIVTLPKTKTELKARVKLIDAVNKEKIKDAVQFTADSNGIWSGKATFEGIDLNQKYYLLIKGPLHLQKKICKADATDPQPGYYSCQFGNITLNDANNDLDFSNVKLLVGDIDQNGVVDSADTSVVFNDLLLPVDQRQSSEVLDRSDLNLDGIVSTQDWSLILEAMKIKYDEK